jgi:hypothetical protein
MMTPTAQRLFELLPMVHRLRDDANGNVLAELLGVIGDELDVLAEETAQFYDDLFIETCAPWAAPYLGDLIGYRILNGVTPELSSPRAEVANTIGYRRRKGTAAVVEQLARDVTGWPGARAVEFFERLTTTQYLNHTRLHALATPDLRHHETLHWAHATNGLNGAFDDLAHTADVRRISSPGPNSSGQPGRHNIPNIGVFLWRIEPVRITRSPLIEHASAQRFRIDALGADEPLFSLPRTEESITHLAEPYDVPLPLARRWMRDHVSDYYGPNLSVLLEVQTGAAEPVPIGLDEVRICDLSDVPGGGGAWAHEPPAGIFAIDPVLGRVYAGTPVAAGDRLLATSYVGMAVPSGAGSSSRQDAIHPEPIVSAARGEDLQPHLDGIATGGTLELIDCDRYAQSLTLKATTAPVGQAETQVRVVAADQARPSLVAATAFTLEMGPKTTVVLDGLLLSGGPLVLNEVGDSQTRTIVVRNCTLTPGHSRTGDGEASHPDRASLIVLDPFARVVIERSVVGAIVAVEGSRVEVRDSIVDGSARESLAICGRERPGGGGLRVVAGVADMVTGDGLVAAGEVDLHEASVMGGIHAYQLDASNSILLARLATGDLRKAAVWAQRRQVGCVRYSFVPEGSRTGKRYRCQPDPGDPAVKRRATRPFFTSLRFGDPAYFQLSTVTPAPIRKGADDESEMGVTHQLFTPQREANLLVRFDEYLRFGLEAGFFYAT